MNQPVSTNLAQQNARIPFNSRFELDYVTFSNLRELLLNRPNPSTAQSRFACYLALYLPEVAARIDEDDFGVLHLEVNVLALATSEAIACSDWDTVRKHFAFVSDSLDNIGKELRDAIQVSYLEYLLLDNKVQSHVQTQQSLAQRLSLTLEGLKAHFGLLATQKPA